MTLRVSILSDGARWMGFWGVFVEVDYFIIYIIINEWRS